MAVFNRQLLCSTKNSLATSNSKTEKKAKEGTQHATDSRRLHLFL